MTPYDGVDYGASDIASATVLGGCYSLSFDGVAANVTIPSTPSLDVSVFTTMFWVYLDRGMWLVGISW